MFHKLKEALGKGNFRQMGIVAPQHATLERAVLGVDWDPRVGWRRGALQLVVT